MWVSRWVECVYCSLTLRTFRSWLYLLKFHLLVKITKIFSFLRKKWFAHSIWYVCCSSPYFCDLNQTPNFYDPRDRRGWIKISTLTLEVNVRPLSIKWRHRRHYTLYTAKQCKIMKWSFYFPNQIIGYRQFITVFTRADGSIYSPTL